MATPKLHLCWLISVAATLLASCTTTVYVRVPAVCPRDQFCLGDGLDPKVDAKARELEFRKRAMAATVDIRVVHYVPNKGRRSNYLVGALVSSKGYVLTTFAGLQGAEAITVILREPTASGGFTAGREIPALPLMLDAQANVALLSLSKSEVTPAGFPVRFGPVITKDRVWTYGGGTALVNGLVLQTGTGESGEKVYADTDIVLKDDYNGAPMLNVCGEVVGVAVSSYGKNARLRFLPIDTALEKLGVTVVDLR